MICCSSRGDIEWRVGKIFPMNIKMINRSQVIKSLFLQRRMNFVLQVLLRSMLGWKKERKFPLRDSHFLLRNPLKSYENLHWQCTTSLPATKTMRIFPFSSQSFPKQSSRSITAQDEGKFFFNILVHDIQLVWVNASIFSNRRNISRLTRRVNKISYRGRRKPGAFLKSAVA